MTQTPACPPPPPEAQAETECETGTEAETGAGTETETGTEAEFETGADAETGTDADAGAGAGAGAGIEFGVEAGSEAGIGTGSEAEAGAGAEAGSEVGAESHPIDDLEPRPAADPLTPAQAFDALYAFAAPALVRQAYLLTGRRELARESVERAFQLAWQRWPEVAVDGDPAGWVRAAAYEYAVSPWHRLRPRHRVPEPPPAALDDRRLLSALLRLPPAYRRALLLHDGLGIGLPETAAETEASTPATANRLLYAREAVAARVPELTDPRDLARRLAELGSKESLRTAAKPVVVRSGSERRARRWTRAAIAFTVLLIGSTAFTVRTAPDHYEAPQAPGVSVSGVPPRPGPGPLSEEDLEVRAKLRSMFGKGPERLRPEPR